MRRLPPMYALQIINLLYHSVDSVEQHQTTPTHLPGLSSYLTREFRNCLAQGGNGEMSGFSTSED